ncbi:hypothetical protein Tco_1428778 [Tanacetum coccineum]
MKIGHHQNNVSCQSTTSASNLKRIQVKDTGEEVEYYLKAYSSARMDISWRDNSRKQNGETRESFELKYLLVRVGEKSEQLAELFTKGTNNVITNVVNEEDLPRLLDSRRENEPFVPKSNASPPENFLPKPQKQWTSVDKRFANQDKRLNSIIISCLPNDTKKVVIKCATAREMWNDLILSHEGPSKTRDTKIAALKLKFNAFKALEGEKDSDSDVEEDTTSSKEFLADLNLEFHDKALLANQKRFYKRSGKDEGTTAVKAFMAIAEDEPDVGKIDSRSRTQPIGTSKGVTSTINLTQTSTVSNNTKKVIDKESLIKSIKKKAQPKTLVVLDPSSEKKVDSTTEKLLRTLMKEIKGLKEHIKPSSENSYSISHTRSSKSKNNKQKV